MKQKLLIVGIGSCLVGFVIYLKKLHKIMLSVLQVR